MSRKESLQARIYHGDEVEVVATTHDESALRASLAVRLDQAPRWTQGAIVVFSTDEVIYRTRKACEE
ncbi:MAG: hypothetical protein V3V61_02285 [Gammaproteobacteria bacterium]